MSDMRRYDYDHICANPLKYGRDVFVLASDAEAAIAAAEQRSERWRNEAHRQGVTLLPKQRGKTQALINDAYERGQRDAIADMDLAAFLLGKREAISEAVQRVEALPRAEYDGHAFGDLTTEAVIAAIKGDTNE